MHDDRLKPKLDLNNPTEALESNLQEANIAKTALALGKLSAEFSEVTRIPRHEDGRHENDTEHSFMLTMVAIGIAEKYYPQLDIEKIERFSLVHDLPEVRTGDINTFDVSPEELAEKQKREQEAIKELLAILPPSLADALEEYERQDTLEAIFVRTVDKLLPLIMDIQGDGFTVVREDFGISNSDDLQMSHTKVRERLYSKFGADFPQLIGAHAVLSAQFEDLYRQKLESSTNLPDISERTFEIERKYLIDLDNLPEAINLDDYEKVVLKQGYVALGDDGSETRVRSVDDERYELTVKTPGMVERGEKTIPLSKDLFDALWIQSSGRRVEKTRYYVPLNSYMVELDIYKGHLNGLATAEVEFDGRLGDARLKAATFIPPTWFGTDISEDHRYKNHSLSQSRPQDLTMEEMGRF